MHGSTSPLPSVLPAAGGAHSRHRAAHLVGVRIDAAIVEQLQAVCRGGPGLAGQRLAARGASATSGEQRAAFPLTVFTLEPQNARTPAVGGHPRAFDTDAVG